VYIVTPRRSAAEVDTVISWIGDQVTAAGGEVLGVNNWGRRRLAYPINRDFEGTYVYTTLRMPTLATAALESAMHITEDVIRHLLIRGIMPYDGTPPPEFVGERPRSAPRPTPAAVAAPEGTEAAPEPEAPSAEQETSEQSAAPEEPAAEPAPTAAAEASTSPDAEASSESPDAEVASESPEAEALAEGSVAAEASTDEATAETEETRE
jgi:small subunit ribosomal protein S6